MPKIVKWIIWALVAFVLVRLVGANPHGAGHAVHTWIAGFWTFLGAI